MTRRHASEGQPHDFEDYAEDIGRQARRLLDELQGVDGGIAAVTDMVRRDPVKALLVAVAGGLALGIFLRR